MSSERKGKGTGRRKIKIQKIENQANLQVTFSKRRAGLFKKAGELDTLCGSESAVIAFSPSEKAHSYGNPDAETITEMYLNSAEGYNIQIQGTDDHNNAITRQRNQKVSDLERQLELEKKYKKELNRIKNENQIQFGVPPNLEDLNYQQLDDLRKAVLAFKQEFQTKLQNPMGSSDIGYAHPNATGIEGEAYNGSFPSASNIQGSSYMANYLAIFNAGSANDAPNNADPSYPNDTMNANNGYVDPLAQLNGNFGLPFQNPHDVASGSNIMDVPFDEETMNTTAEHANVHVPWGIRQGYVPGNNQGFPSNGGF